MPPKGKGKKKKKGGKQTVLFSKKPKRKRGDDENEDSEEEDEDEEPLHVANTLEWIGISEKYKDQFFLMTESVYKNNVPDDAKGKLFKYKFQSYDGTVWQFKLEYANQAIDLEGKVWIDFPSDDTTLTKITLKQMKAGKERYLRALGRVNAARHEVAEATKAAINILGDSDSDDDVKLDDIEEMADEFGGNSLEVILTEFKIVKGSEVNVSDKSKKRQWKHKKNDVTFWQYTQQNMKKWDSGVYRVWLGKLAKNTKGAAQGKKSTMERCQYILELRKNSKAAPPPASGLALYTAEEDLLNHVRETEVIINAGTGVNFYNNPCVRKLLRGLNDRHRPVYWQKTMRLLRCINDVLSQEIYLMVAEGLLAFGDEAIVSSNSDFWTDKVTKKSYGACVGNLMARRYTFTDGLALFMSNSTQKSIKREDLKFKTGNLDRCAALIDFLHFPQAHTGENIGQWLTKIHIGMFLS